MQETELLEKTSTEEKLKSYKPKMYDVIFLNDDYTPFDFVVSLLMNVFGHNEEKAQEITMKVHIEGSGVAGTYTYDIATQKQNDSLYLARSFNFPLEIIIREKQWTSTIQTISIKNNI